MAKRLTVDEEAYIPGIFNYCDRWCERCAFTSRCRLFADEKQMRDKRNRGRLADEAEDPDEATNAAFWNALDAATNEAMAAFADELVSNSMDEIEAHESRLDELTDRDPLVKLAHDYSMGTHDWMQSHEADLPSEEHRFRARRDAITPHEALEVIAWHEFQITVKLARATRGRLEAQEDADDSEDESWDTGSEWPDDDEEKVDLAAMHQSDADGSARVALLGIERSIGAWTILRDAYPQEDGQIQGFLRKLTRLRRLLEQALPGARTFHRPGFDD